MHTYYIIAFSGVLLHNPLPVSLPVLSFLISPSSFSCSLPPLCYQLTLGISWPFAC